MKLRTRLAILFFGAALFPTDFSLDGIDSSGSSLSGIRAAEARIGHPLTPLSYAGVSRRTTRRIVVRRTTIRVAVLPAGCVYGLYYGAYYYRCGAIYYQRSGGVYVKVVFD